MLVGDEDRDGGESINSDSKSKAFLEKIYKRAKAQSKHSPLYRR